MVKALGTIKAYYDYGMFQAIQIAAIVALRGTEAAVEAQARFTRAPQRAGRRPAKARLGHPPRGRHVRLGQDPRALGQPDEHDGFRHEAAGGGDVAVSPGAGFGPAGEGYLRMALVENENRLRQAVRQIGRCLGEASA